MNNINAVEHKLSQQIAELTEESRELQDIRYLKRIRDTGTVVHPMKTMADVMVLLERGWMDWDAEQNRYIVSARGEDVLARWDFS